MTRFDQRLAELDAFIQANKRWPRKDEQPSLYQWASHHSKSQELKSRKAAILLGDFATRDPDQSAKDS